MLTRSDLETSLPPVEMRELVYSVLSDCETYPSKTVLRGEGFIKDLFEEYWPLSNLAVYLHASSGHLTPKYNEGPDGIIRLVTGEEMNVQITASDESYQEALNRELISQGRLAFSTTNKSRNARTGEIVEVGSPFMSPEGYLGSQVNKVVEAIGRKLPKYHEGTEALLISISVLKVMQRKATTYDWRQNLSELVRDIEFIPYPKLYVANNEEIIELIG